MRYSEKKYQSLGLVVTSIGCVALIVACARDLVAPQQVDPGDTQQLYALPDSGAVAAASRPDVTSIRDSRPANAKSSPSKKLPPGLKRSVEDGTGVANEAFGLEVRDYYGTEVVAYHMDASASHIDKLYIYHEGESIYHAELTWTPDPSGDYISGVTQTMYYNNVPTAQTRYTCNGDRFCEVNQMRLPIGRRIHAAIAAKGFASVPNFTSAPSSLLQGSPCDAAAVSAFAGLIQNIAGIYVSYQNQSSPPPPSANLAHSLDCPASLAREQVNIAADFWKSAAATAYFTAIKSYQSATEIWDELNRPASVGATPLPYDNMFTRDATSCETVLGHLACESITQKMAPNTQ